MHTSNLFIIAVVSYFLGSIPFGYILVRFFTGADVRAQGSGNIGATNVARTGKKGLAIATLFLDALKGWLAVWLALRGFEHRWYDTHGHAGTSATYLQMSLVLASIAALMAVVGHMFPVWLRFNGGKGVATGLGVFVALAPKALVICLFVFVVLVAVTRYVSLGSVAASAVFPASFWYFNREGMTPFSLVMVCAVPLLIIYKHKDNIRRLVAGTENKLGAKKN